MSAAKNVAKKTKMFLGEFGAVLISALIHKAKSATVAIIAV